MCQVYFTFRSELETWIDSEPEINKYRKSSRNYEQKFYSTMSRFVDCIAFKVIEAGIRLTCVLKGLNSCRNAFDPL